MTIYHIGKVLHITEQDTDFSGGMIMTFPTLADGTAVSVTRQKDQKTLYGTVKRGKISAPADFFTNSDYTIYCKNTDGEPLHTAFVVRDGQTFEHVGASHSRAELWEAIIYLAEKLNNDEKKIDRVVDGYATE